MRTRFYLWLSRHLPKKILYWCAIQVLAETTTGKYGNTLVPELTMGDALTRFGRIHGFRGHGKDEFYDSNRNER